jgi:F-type H+-transporting ATPase subunit b
MEAIIPKLGEFIPALVAFGVLFFVLSKFAFPPLMNMLDERAANIRGSLEKAEATRIEAERLLEEYKGQLAEGRQEAQKIIQQSKQVADTMKDEIVAKANSEAASVIEKAKLAIEAEKKAAMAELQASVADLSVAVTRKVIGNDLTSDEHVKLIEKYVAEAGGLNAN